MTITKNIKFAGVIVALLALLGIMGYAASVQANPLRFPPAVTTASATTSATFLTVAGATTTLVTYDSYANNGISGGGSTQALDQAAVLIQLAASSTSSQLNLTVQHSQDGIDWYDDEVFTPTSAGYNNILNPVVFTWLAASTATTSKAMVVKTPLRYMRVQAKISGAAGAVWAAIQPQKQSQ